MKLVDDDVQLSTPITAGRHTIRIENLAQQPHEAFIARLLPGGRRATCSSGLAKDSGARRRRFRSVESPASRKGGHIYTTREFVPGTAW